MLDSLIALYNFITDLPLLISILAAFSLPAFASKGYEAAMRHTSLKALHWAAGLAALVLALALYWLIWRMIGLPQWIGWIAPRV